MASKKRLSVWGVLARVGLTGDHDAIIEHVFEMTSRTTLRSNDGEPMDGGDFLCRVFDSLGTTRDWPCVGSEAWVRLRLLALRKVVSRLTHEGLLDCVAVSSMRDAVCDDDARAAKGEGAASQVRCVMPDGGRESDPPHCLVNQDGAEGDGEGTVVGDPEGTSLRFDAIYIKPVAVTLHGATAIWPPSYGRVKLKPDGSRRSVVVALDDLDDRSRQILRNARARLRTEAVVRCRIAHCTQCFRAWMRPDGGVEDTKGEPLSEFGSLFAARCARHRLTP